MSGPFRDPLPALVAEAERQLAELREQRFDLERRYKRARLHLDDKVVVSQLRPVPPLEDGFRWTAPEPRAARAAAIAGVVIGLVSWLELFARPH